MFCKENVDIDISVVIPLYKGQKYCGRLLDMVEENCLYDDLFQKCKIEVIFVNDFPDENIIIDKDQTTFMYRLIVQDKNQGIHSSRVKGIQAAQGKYIIMLDQDDIITKKWLYSQWHKITSENGDYCVCNGWLSRFRTLWDKDTFNNKVNNLRHYMTVGNAIASPGQVIIKREALPQEWLDHIQFRNGADDFLLWVMALAQGKRFLVNEQYLFYHTPERTKDSVGKREMVYSVQEATEILEQTGILEDENLSLLKNWVEGSKWINGINTNDDLYINNNVLSQIQNYMKFQSMFHIMLGWMKLRNQGIGLWKFFEKKNYLNVAIYGMGYIGECVYDELRESSVLVKYGIDKTAVDFKGELPVFRVQDKLEPVDAVVLTIAGDKDFLSKAVKEKLDCSVWSVSEILLDLAENFVYMHSTQKES